MSQVGYWATHEYERRSVEKDVKEFVGWPIILKGCLMFHRIMDRVLYALTYLSCARIGEAIRLRKQNFIIEDDKILVVRMLLLKHYEKEYSYLVYEDELPQDSTKHLWTHDPQSNKYFRKRFKTEKLTEYRTDFDIPRFEPMTNLLINWIESTDDYLFPGYSRDLRFPEHDRKHIHRVTAYKHLTKIGIFPHWLRSQRASCLKAFYNIPDKAAMAWCGWEDPKTWELYSKMGRLELTSLMRRPPPVEALELDKMLTA